MDAVEQIQSFYIVDWCVVVVVVEGGRFLLRIFQKEEVTSCLS